MPAEGRHVQQAQEDIAGAILGAIGEHGPPVQRLLNALSR